MHGLATVELMRQRVPALQRIKAGAPS